MQCNCPKSNGCPHAQLPTPVGPTLLERVQLWCPVPPHCRAGLALLGGPEGASALAWVGRGSLGNPLGALFPTEQDPRVQVLCRLLMSLHGVCVPACPEQSPPPLGHRVSHSGALEELPRVAWGPLWPFLLSVLSLTHCPRWQGSVVDCLCPESVSPSKGPSNVSPAGVHPPSLLVSTSLHECPWGSPDSEKPAAPWPRRHCSFRPLELPSRAGGRLLHLGTCHVAQAF